MVQVEALVLAVVPKVSALVLVAEAAQPFVL
jgi:hypothetical protein